MSNLYKITPDKNIARKKLIKENRRYLLSVSNEIAIEKISANHYKSNGYIFDIGTGLWHKKGNGEKMYGNGVKTFVLFIKANSSTCISCNTPIDSRGLCMECVNKDKLKGD